MAVQAVTACLQSDTYIQLMSTEVYIFNTTHTPQYLLDYVCAPTETMTHNANPTQTKIMPAQLHMNANLSRFSPHKSLTQASLHESELCTSCFMQFSTLQALSRRARGWRRAVPLRVPKRVSTCAPPGNVQLTRSTFTRAAAKSDAITRLSRYGCKLQPCASTSEQKRD